jgi:hypothetical protein
MRAWPPRDAASGSRPAMISFRSGAQRPQLAAQDRPAHPPGWGTVAEIQAGRPGMGPASQRLVRAAAGPGIRSPAPGPGTGPGLEKRWGAPRAAHPVRGVVALGDDSGNPPADAGQWGPRALGYVVVHHSSLIAVPNLAAPRARATPANKAITMIVRKHTGFIHPFRAARC